ncbi:MAG: apolipoprotein N-acyltransferase [Desulfobacterales bacterium]|nr:MAG: apolipoprotein N-acyltransferase [Desulfobacterales bacterium]
MRVNFSSLIIRLLAAVLSGIFVILAFPKYDLWWLAWVALVPLFLALYGGNVKYSILTAWVFGIITFAGLFSWILEVRGYTWLHQTIIVSYLSVFFALLGLIIGFVSRRLGLAAAMVATPFIWVSIEYLRANFFFLAFPYAWLAHTQHQNIVLIQFASLIGAYGVSFLVVMTNAGIAAVILAFSQRFAGSRPTAFHSSLKRVAVVMTSVTLLSVGLALLYGKYALSHGDAGEKIKVSVIQGNIPQEEKWDPNFANSIMEKYTRFTLQASKEMPALIAWPEASTPGFIFNSKRSRLLNRIAKLAAQANTHLLVGSSEYPKFYKVTSKGIRTGNTAVLFSPQGEIVGRYSKIRLVPFGEYIPLEGKVPWPEFIVPDQRTNYEIPGKDYKIFDLNGIKFSVSVCWESHFPNLIRKFARRGARFMLNIANEGRYGETAAPYQLLAMTIFRSVENRLPIARATNTGISCFIDQFGRVTGWVENQGKKIFVEGISTQEIGLPQVQSFYTRYGYVFIYICLVISGLLIILAVLGVRKFF